MYCSDIMITYYWKLDYANINVYLINGICHSINNIFWLTSKYCHHKTDLIEGILSEYTINHHTVYLN